MDGSGQRADSCGCFVAAMTLTANQNITAQRTLAVTFTALTAALLTTRWMTTPSHDTCWFLEPKHAPVFSLLGRAGDTILMFPAFREIHRRTGFKPRIVVSTEYAGLYDGISYATAVPASLQWWTGVPKARAIAAALASDACFPQWWLEPDPMPAEYKGTFNLTCHGNSWGVNVALWPNFMTSMYSRAGFTRDEMLALPLVFDRRNLKREAELIAKLYPPVLRKKPLLLTNFTGISSPFGFLPELHPTLHRFARDFHTVDLGNVRATRLYDLLGLYDIAAGIITIDTATLHLAHATPTPYIAFTVDGWTSSEPRGNVALHVKYNETTRRLAEVAAVLDSWRKVATLAAA